MTIRCLHHLLIYVADLDRAVSFYARLGMEPIPSLGPRIRWMRMGPNELHLMANEGDWQRYREEPSPHFAIEADDIQQAQALIPTIGGEILQEIGTRPHDGSWYLFALDPDGNRFEVTQHGEDWHRRNDLIEDLKRREAIRDPRIEGALRSVPRHLFLPAKTLEEAYSDQAIMTKEQGEARSSCSQPWVVARMLEMLALRGGENVLEIGAGTGWNSALLSALAGPNGRVTTVDIDEDTAQFARENHARAKVESVHVACADGGEGWPQAAPFDAIMATAGVSDIPPPWLDQLREGGVLVAPLWFNTAQFCGAWDKRGGVLSSREQTWAGFMPLRGRYATARTVEEGGATFLFDEFLQFDLPALRGLLDGPTREIEAPELPEIRYNVSPFLEYAALRGEPLMMLTLPGARNAVTALSSTPTSLLAFGARAHLYGSAESEARLRELLRDWEAAGRPGITQARIEIAARGTLEPQAGAFLVRKTWADYRVRFEAEQKGAAST